MLWAGRGAGGISESIQMPLRVSPQAARPGVKDRTVGAFKIGAVTGLTSGTFHSFDATLDNGKDTAHFNDGHDCLLVRWDKNDNLDPTYKFATNGDSGSLYFVEYKSRFVAIGIHLGSAVVDYDGKKVHVSFGCPFWHIHFEKRFPDKRVMKLTPLVAREVLLPYWHLPYRSEDPLKPAATRSSSSDLNRLIL